MKSKLKLAFEQLENEVSTVSEWEQGEVKGGILRDANGNIIFVSTGITSVTHGSGYSTSMETGYIYTDDGAAVEVFFNLGGDPGFDTDCHGVTFAGGQYWINDSEVESILVGDGYTSQLSGNYEVGNIVIYYDAGGNVVHSATITSTDGGTNTTVYGQGGLEVDNHYDPIDSAFYGYSYYQVYQQDQD